jgi:formate-dependent nitrite reductase membrane component NrfD
MRFSEPERAPYGRQPQTTDARGDSKSTDFQDAGETYYGQAVLKPSHYGQLIATYLFIGGIAGASQMIATIADLCGERRHPFIVRAGRYLSLGGILTGPLFLIADLRTPERWYNMLRIFRRTSPMSIGSWALTGFGALSGITATLQFLADRLRRPGYRRAARAAALPATAAGAVVATYTGTLLGSTSTPIWARASQFLPALFGISAVATSTAALSLAAHASGVSDQTTRHLEKLALITAGAELFVSAAVDRQWAREKLAAPLGEQPIARAYRAGYKGLAIGAPLIVYGLSFATSRRSRGWSIAAAAATLVGGYFLRSVLVQAGKDSAKRPEDYFHITRAE